MIEEFTWSTNVVANIDELTHYKSADVLKDMTGEHKYTLDDVTRDIIKNSKKIKCCCYEPFSEEHPTSLGTFDNPVYGTNDVTEEEFFLILWVVVMRLYKKYIVSSNFADDYVCKKFTDLKLMAVEFVQCENGTTRIIIDIE